jgi:hypothetical protein
MLLPVQKRWMLAMLVQHLYTEKASEAHEAGKKIPSVMHEQPRMLYVHTAMNAQHARVVQVD